MHFYEFITKMQVVCCEGGMILDVTRREICLQIVYLAPHVVYNSKSELISIFNPNFAYMEKLMNLNQLTSFVTVCKTLNFTNAARQIGVPQSTISRQINDLEEQLEVKLFYRTKRDVQLTAEGQAFLPYAQEILDAAQSGTQAVKQLRTGAKGRLSVATIETSNGFLTDCLKVFVEKYPDILVDINCISTAESLSENSESTYDFYFMYQDMIPETEEFETITTHQDSLCFIAPAGHSFDPENLQAEKFIMVAEDENPILYMQVMNFCRSQRVFPNIINRVKDPKAVLLSVGTGLGVSILPESFLKGFHLENSFDIHRIENEAVSIPCAAVWKRSLLNPAALLFLEVIREMAPKIQ